MNLTTESLGALLVVLLAGWLWLNTLRARELALAHARRACERNHVQLLDQAVALRGIGLRWTARGLRLRRTYGFEFSVAGVERRSARVVLLGLQLERLELGDDAGGTEDDSGDGDAAGGPASGRFEP
jgi:hypothetical protein